MYMEVSWRSYLVADVGAPRPAMKSSGYEVDETFVGCLFYSLSVGGKNKWQMARCSVLAWWKGYASSEVTLVEVLVYGNINMTDVDFVKETKAVVLWRWFC